MSSADVSQLHPDVVQEYWLPINALTAIMFPIIGFFEITRLQGFAKTGKVRHAAAPLLLSIHTIDNDPGLPFYTVAPVMTRDSVDLFFLLSLH